MFGIRIIRQSRIAALEHENSQLKANYKNLKIELANLKQKFVDTKFDIAKDIANYNILKAERDKLSKNLEKERKLNRHLEKEIEKLKNHG